MRQRHPLGLKPKWTGEDWQELATPAEIEAEEKEKYEAMGLPWPPKPPPPTENIAEIQAQAIDELIIMVFELQSEIDELKSQ